MFLTCWQFLIHSTTLSRICMKLVVVMGIVWVADILSWAHSLWYDDLYYVWIITDLINTLQGVFIWLVVGCQPQVRNWYANKINFSLSGFSDSLFVLLCSSFSTLNTFQMCKSNANLFNKVNVQHSMYPCINVLYTIRIIEISYSGFQCTKTNVEIKKDSIST